MNLTEILINLTKLNMYSNCITIRILSLSDVTKAKNAVIFSMEINEYF